MASEDRFKQSVVVTLAKRAANQCSNPDCGAITSGPADNPDDSVNVGEAAHICGANEGSARFDAAMSSVERSAIANAIWLCGNCHKRIDDDVARYPVGLLRVWRNEHERKISRALGKAGADAREKFERRHLSDLGELTYLAETLIVEKEDLWEFLLTAEMLRAEISPVAMRWNALKRDLYVKPTLNVRKLESADWLIDRLHEIQSIVQAFTLIINREFSRAWGPAGVSGNEAEIVFVVRLFGEVCRSALAWEESVKFSRVDEALSETRDLFVGIAGGLIAKAEQVPKFLVETLASKPTSGAYSLELMIALPDGWELAVDQALQRALPRLAS